MSKYAIFIAASWNYVQYLNALLNSLEKRKINVDVYVLHWEFEQKYLDAIQCFPYKVIPIEIKEADHDIKGVGEPGKNLFIKQARFHYIAKYGKDYDAICLLDADNFIVSENFMNFFELVKGTNKLIGCEESYKWELDSKYQCKGKTLFPEPVKALKFMCSVPVIFDFNQWEEVFKTYNEMAFHSYEIPKEPGQRIKRIGDIYTWSISVYLNNRQNDCILFPMHTMTQVHGTMGTFWCGVDKHGDNWKARDGKEVYSIHGRIGTKNWAQSQRNWYTNSIKSYGCKYEGNIEKICEKSLKLVQNEWKELNFDSRVKLSDFVPMCAEWEKLWDS